MKYYLKGNYYFDIDLQNQLRIAGPKNHLLLGISFPESVRVEVASSEIVDEQLVIELKAQASEMQLTLPLVTDMRTLRSYVEPVVPTPTYDQLVEKGIDEVLPDKIEMTEENGKKFISFTNVYADVDGQEQEYGARVGVEKSCTLELRESYLHVGGESPMSIWVETSSNVSVDEPLEAELFQPSAELSSELFAQELLELYALAGEQVEHLIRTKKTSGFEYGTIFPRDWIESADLGANDLSDETVNYMYKQAMQYVSEEGEGWHEDLVGQLRANSEASLHVDRKMVDIEPKYILGFKVLSTPFLLSDEIKERMQRVGRYVLHMAEKKSLITFKEVENQPEQYHFIGNWRDSYHAFPRQKSPLAPYDVNCVLYPEALKVMAEHADYFEVDEEKARELMRKWQGQKVKYRLYHPGDIIGYSLALHGRKQIPLPIAHTDEAYDLFYGDPSMEEVVSFARKLMSEDFFYTPAGPTIVARDEEDFTERHYHGKVIWPKQTAYCVAGLTRQYLRGVAEEWQEQVVEEIKQAALETAEASFRAFLEFKAIPELYYYDSDEGRARLYTDQSEYEGQMSIIQLWSSVGLRRMMRDYARLQGYTLAGKRV